MLRVSEVDWVLTPKPDQTGGGRYQSPEGRYVVELAFLEELIAVLTGVSIILFVVLTAAAVVSLVTVIFVGFFGGINFFVERSFSRFSG